MDCIGSFFMNDPVDPSCLEAHLDKEIREVLHLDYEV